MPTRACSFVPICASIMSVLADNIADQAWRSQSLLYHSNLFLTFDVSRTYTGQGIIVR